MRKARVSVTRDGMGWCVTLHGAGMPYVLIDEITGSNGADHYVKFFDQSGRRVNISFGGILTVMQQAIEFVSNYHNRSESIKP